MPGPEIELPFNLTFDLFALANILAAGAVTVHALLRKRDVRGAIGWIGLAWLSPIAGSVLYYLFGINRVMRRAARLAPGAIDYDPWRGTQVAAPDDVSLPENIRTIAQVAGRVTGRPLTDGNRVMLLDGGDHTYPAMLDAIGAARRSVALASYIFRADRIGGAFVEALADARRRGVEIRVLVDGIGSGYFVSSAPRALRRSGVPAARFMHDWLPWRMPFLNMRNHKKLLIVDGSLGFVGGLNLGRENLRLGRRRASVEDVHFRVDGPVVALLVSSFAEDWTFTTGEVLSGDAWWPRIAPTGTVIARGISSGPDEDMGKLEAVLASAVSAAKHRLRIVTPYFLPDHRLMAFIALAALRGVRVEVIVPERSDHRLLDWAMRGHLGFFAIPGITVYLTRAPFDHSKLATIDGLWSAFGSPNWDVRSLRLNFEFMLECYDAATARDIDRLIDAKIARARRLSPQDLAGRPLPIVLRDAAARLLLPYL